MTLAGKEYTFKDFTSLQMDISARSLFYILNTAIQKYAETLQGVDAEDADLDAIMDKAAAEEKTISKAFKAFAEMALNEPIEADYFGITREEYAHLRENFIGGFPVQTIPNS